MPSLPLRRRQMMTKGEVISNPGRRLALCVAPYFADRGVGDMRGPPNGTPICHPRGGSRPSLHTQPCGTQDDTHCTTAEAQPRTTSGVRLCTGAIWHAPHVATTPRGEIRGYARLPPPPGWRKCSPPVIVSASGGGAGAAPDGKPRGGVPERNEPALTQLCSGCGVPPTTVCRRFAPVAQWSVKARLKSEEWDKMQIQGATAQ